MSTDTASVWERVAGVTSGVAVLAWLATLSMWAAQLVAWLFGAEVPHPSIIGIARAMSRWFGIADHTWADRPYAGITLYTVLKDAYITSSCLVVAALFSVLSVLIIVRDDRSRALGIEDIPQPESPARPEDSTIA